MLLAEGILKDNDVFVESSDGSFNLHSIYGNNCAFGPFFSQSVKKHVLIERWLGALLLI